MKYILLLFSLLIASCGANGTWTYGEYVKECYNTYISAEANMLAAENDENYLCWYDKIPTDKWYAECRLNIGDIQYVKRFFNNQKDCELTYGAKQ